MRRRTLMARRFTLLVASFSTVAAAFGLPADERVVLESGGWRLVGEWLPPDGNRGPFPAALLLHRAAGSRREHEALAEALLKRGVASLRLDLRGHGESDNLGRFEEPYAEHLHVNEKAYEDVAIALRWMAAQPGIDPDRLAAVGASYSGEAIGEAVRLGGARASAYVILSPGSFSEASIAAVDASGVPWLFIRTREESPTSLEFIDAVFAALARDSRSAEIRILPGAGHGTRIFDQHPFILEDIADWLAERLDAR